MTLKRFVLSFTVALGVLAATVPLSANLNVSTLSAISADLGTVTAGSLSAITISGSSITGISLVVGTGSNTLWLGDGDIEGDGIMLAIGGTTRTSAPFIVTPTGSLIVGGSAAAIQLQNGADITISDSGGVLFVASSATQQFGGFTGGGNRVLCINNSGVVFMGSTAAEC